MNENKSKQTSFVFTHRKFDGETGTLRLGYSYPGICDFEETIIFGPSSNKLSTDGLAALENSFHALHLAAGVSYYKAYVPEQITINDGPLSDRAADFFENLYFNGLGEFAFRNKLKLKDKIKFPRGGKARGVGKIIPSNKTLVPVGGGKDSLVTVEALRKSGMDITLCAINKPGPIVACMDASSLERIFIERKIDKALLDLNSRGALNGHVPITAIISLILVSAAIWHGFDGIAFSNERSANEGNIDWEGRTVNHQFSKSGEFENALSRFIKTNIAEELDCFSFLRPLSELHIAKIFARETRYDNVFTSCNKSYRIEGAMTDRRWCCDCPKCRFVFLMLAPFMEKARLVEIFGNDLLDDENQINGFSELLGLSGHKPWECVGETVESASSFSAISSLDDWAESAVIKSLARKIAGGKIELATAFDTCLSPESSNNIPARFKGAFDAIIK